MTHEQQAYQCALRSDRTIAMRWRCRACNKSAGETAPKWIELVGTILTGLAMIAMPFAWIELRSFAAVFVVTAVLPVILICAMELAFAGSRCPRAAESISKT